MNDEIEQNITDLTAETMNATHAIAELQQRLDRAEKRIFTAEQRLSIIERSFSFHRHEDSGAGRIGSESWREVLAYQNGETE